jgi:AcrR family transcriptional regulator
MSPRKYTLGKRSAHVDQTRQRIIDATYELHAEKGIRATSMQDVAQRADVALRTVYNHFPTLDDLVLGCGGKVIARMAAPTDAIFDGVTDLEGRLRRLVGETFAMYERVAAPLESAYREQASVAALATVLNAEAVRHRALVETALRGVRMGAALSPIAMALTDFAVWRAIANQGMTTQQASDVVVRGLMAAAQEISGDRRAPARRSRGNIPSTENP